MIAIPSFLLAPLESALLAADASLVAIRAHMAPAGLLRFLPRLEIELGAPAEPGVFHTFAHQQPAGRVIHVVRRKSRVRHHATCLC